jgi:small-conductance mechanosensitive channel
MMNHLLVTIISNFDPKFLIELSLILASFFTSYVFKKFFDKRFLSGSAQINFIKDANRRQRFIKNYRYVSYPLYLTFIIAILFIASSSVELPGTLIIPATQFSIIWFSLRLITAVSGSKSPKMIVIIVGVFLILNILGLTDVITESLDKLSLQLGSFNLSALLIIKAILALIICLWIINLISQITRTVVSGFSSLNVSAKNITTVIIDIALYFFLFLIILKLIGFDITAIAVVGSAVGIGFGFGLQKITSNFISGLILLFERSIKEGDVVELSTNPEDIGYIKRMGIRYTLIRTFDNKEIMMPNEDFITNRVTNWTFSDKEVRVKIEVGVDYGSDLDLVKKLILESATENCGEDVKNKPVCFLSEFGDSSVNFILYSWVSNVELVQHAKKSDILFAMWNKFKDNKIKIPFPQRDLHLKSSDLKTVK